MQFSIKYFPNNLIKLELHPVLWEKPAEVVEGSGQVASLGRGFKHVHPGGDPRADLGHAGEIILLGWVGTDRQTNAFTGHVLWK